MKPNFAMWRKAVVVIPRINDEEWHALDFVSRWLISTRFSAIIMTVIAALIAGILAFRFETINIGMWFVFAVALVLAHATNNTLNDLVDYKRGVDRGNYFRDQYGPQPLERGFMSARSQLLFAAANGVLAIAGGIALIFYRDGMTLPLMLIGAFFVLFYTYPLKYFALGEISLVIVYGPLIIGGGYYALTGSWSWSAVLASLPFAIGVSATLFGKHIDKIDMDREKRVHTLPVVIGERASRVVVIVMIALQYLITGYMIFIHYFTPVLAVTLLALPYFFRVLLPMYRRPRPSERPARYPEERWPLWFVGSAFRFTRRFGMLYVLGIMVDTALHLLMLR